VADVGEADLVARCRAGERDACDDLLRPYYPLALSLARSLWADREWAEDAALEAMYQVYKSIGSFRAESTFRTWVCRITMRVCYKELDRRRRAQAEPVLVETHDPPTETPAAILLGKCRQEEAIAAVARLPELYRLPVALRYMAECNYREIAELLDIPEGTARRRVFQGLGRTRRMFPESDREEAD